MLEVRICEVRVNEYFYFLTKFNIDYFSRPQLFLRKTCIWLLSLSVWKGMREEYKHINLTGTYSECLFKGPWERALGKRRSRPEQISPLGWCSLVGASSCTEGQHWVSSLPLASQHWKPCEKSLTKTALSVTGKSRMITSFSNSAIT